MNNFWYIRIIGPFAGGAAFGHALFTDCTGAWFAGSAGLVAIVSSFFMKTD